MKKRPKDGPFGALHDLRHKVRVELPAPRQPTPETPPATPLLDDTAAFHAAVSGVKPLPEHRRATIARPRPAAVPRPKTTEPDETSAKPKIRTDPNDPLALFQEAMAGVAPIRDTGRADTGRRVVRQKPAYLQDMAATTSSELQEIILPVDEHDPQALFRHVVGTASPLPDRNLAALDKPQPPPRPLQREQDEASALRESIDAPLSFQDRLDIGEEGVYLRDSLPRRVLTDLRRGRWVVQGELDLHGLTRNEARTELSHFLHEALKQGHRCIRLIHGKGHGSPGREPVLKHLSRGWLMQREEILAFCQAKPHDGGEGALLVLLHNRKECSK